MGKRKADNGVAPAPASCRRTRVESTSWRSTKTPPLFPTSREEPLP